VPFNDISTTPNVGCLNGGGQLKARPGQTQAQLVAALDEAYHHTSIVPRSPNDNPMVTRLYDEEFGSHPFSNIARMCLHTEYHARDKPAAVVVASDW
jgi:iron only hydrogenase large subunit-like protein